ncbi:MAG: ABC transporter ATP-binding protein [Thermodesulfobacteriota bacterium]
MALALLEVRGLSKYFGGIRAVDRCSFTVEEGSITALIGPNGAGKTTVFNLVSGLLKPDAGMIFFTGEQIDGLQPHQITRKGIRRTFQITRDLMEMTVMENMVVQSPTKGFMDLFKGGILRGERDRAMDLLDFVGIAHLANEKAKNLSYGQKKLMEFAATLMAEPQLVLLDEPAGGINPALLEDIVDRIRLLNKQGITFLIVEHNMDLVMSLCEPVIVMAYGKVLAEGHPENIQNNKEVLEAYLGEA